MADYQHGGYAVAGGDLPVKNYAVTDIGANLVVLIDSANAMGPDAYVGVKLPSSGGGVVGTYGITQTPIAAGKTGLVRVIGSQWVLANGTVTAGEYVQASDTAAKLGYVKTCTAATEQIGQAISTATDGVPVHVLICKAKNA